MSNQFVFKVGAAVAVAVCCCVGVGCGGTDEGGDRVYSAAPPISVAPTMAPGPTGDTLSKEAAAAILAKEITGPAPCTWRGLSKHTDTTWIFMATDDVTRSCGEALQSAGIAKLGKCVDDNPRAKCFKREIAPSGKEGTRMSEPTSELVFTCGKTEFQRVVSVTTKDPRTAVVKFVRTVTMDAPLLKSIEVCALGKTEAGELERERTFQRDDSGTWTLLPRQ